ncbi:MAG: FG-GAP-like repeat-containing protein [Lentisphaerae bacterium]|nr:FG-GAP-like repeat-containing protein [Lentisphaerota bacterium]
MLTILRNGMLMWALVTTTFTCASAGQYRLAWDAPIFNTDGSAITNLAGYRILYGTASQDYTSQIDIGLINDYTVSNLADGQRYYFAVCSVNSSAVYSAPSPELIGDVAPAAVPASLAVSTQVVEMSTLCGSNPGAGSLLVWNRGGGTLSYTLSSSVAWLSVLPLSGTSTGECDTILLAPTCASLPAGTYSAAIAVQSSGASTESATVQVNLSIYNRYYRDADRDGFGNDAVTTLACTTPSGYTSQGGDCNDSSASVNPAAGELLNGIDDNCNGLVDEGLDVPVAAMDFDGDVRTDPTVFLPSTGAWFVHGSDGADLQKVLGTAATFTTPEDYDGDMVTDFAVYAPLTGTWTVFDSSTGLVRQRTQGGAASLPVPADYDGDGAADFAVFNTNTFEWAFILTGGGTRAPVKLGTAGVVPAPADYDGDGRADLAVYAPSTRRWTVVQSSNGISNQYKLSSSIGLPSPADYDADGKVDMAEYDYAAGVLRVRNSTTGRVTQWKSGLKNNVPVPGDYDGDGAADLAVFNPAKGLWTIDLSQGASYTLQLGGSGWRPAHAAYAINRQVLSLNY